MAIRMNRDRILTRHSNIVHHRQSCWQITQVCGCGEWSRSSTLLWWRHTVEAKSPAPSSSLRQHPDDDTRIMKARQILTAWWAPLKSLVCQWNDLFHLPNISISVTPIEKEMQIFDDSYNAVPITVKNKRGSFWKRTKRFFRRLVYCCG